MQVSVSNDGVQTSAVRPRHVTVKQAAIYFGVYRSTIRRWIQQDCPCVSLGSVGRTHGTILDLDAMQAWRVDKLIPERARDTQVNVLSIVETALLDALKLDDIARRARVTDLHVTRIVLMIFERVYLNVKQEPLTRAVLSKQMKQLCANCIGSVARD